MPIVFSCSCGEALKAKEAFAGRKVKCTQCGKVLRTPREGMSGLEKAVLGLALLGGAAAGYFMLMNH
jgi:Domain of unknown function (DUF1922)